MGTLRDKLGLNKPKPAPRTIRLPEPIPPKPPPPDKPKPGKPIVVATELVTATCGHQTLFEIYAENKDKFREARRAKATGRICPACRQLKEAEEMAAARERRKHRQAARRAKEEHEGKDWRLPDGASFQTVYEAEHTRWSGTLTLRTDAGILTFTNQASAVFKLLRNLDRQYRSYLIAMKNKEQQGTERQACNIPSGS